MQIANTYRNATPTERRRIQTAVVIENRELVARIVSGLVPQAEHHDEGNLVGSLGVLVALEKYDPTSGEAFEDLAMAWAGREIKTWLDSGVQWVQPDDGTTIRDLSDLVAELPPIRQGRPGKYQHHKPLCENATERAAFSVAFERVPEAFTPNERAAVEAVFFEGMSVKAAAAKLGANVNTFQERLTRSRAALRAWMRRQAAS